jgi:hypothetical protein
MLVNAVRMHMDWRPLAGLTHEDEGTLVEQVLSQVVLTRAVEQNNADVARANRK